MNGEGLSMAVNNIKHYRQIANLTQKELGEALTPRLVQRSVSAHEQGTRTPSVYQALEYAAVLGVTVEELFPAKPAAVRTAA